MGDAIKWAVLGALFMLAPALAMDPMGLMNNADQIAQEIGAKQAAIQVWSIWKSF